VLRVFTVVAAGFALTSAAMTQARQEAVSLVRLPAGGIQPQVAVDSRGVVHVVYFTGEPANGDLFHATLAGDGTFSPPRRVNSEPGSAIAIGSVRGAHLAAGRNGRLHVAWNGSGTARPKAPDGTTPMLYTRTLAGRVEFEPQRNLIHAATGLDGGGIVAADAAGRVFVAWHAGGPGSKGEADRRVWVATSSDDGATFAREVAASDPSTGACGCCGMGGLVDRRGALFLQYRSARDLTHRDSYLLRSTDGARSFASTNLQAWNINACPMSTYALAEGPEGVLAAWETAGQVQFIQVSQAAGAPARAIEAPGSVRTRKHPVIATDPRGDVLLAWTEDMGWQRGGAVAWQVFDKQGQPTAVSGRVSGVPVWSLVAAYARPRGGFTIVY
jgi:hypothetical protein